MSIITLITDFGYKDQFVAQMKGEIYSNNPDSQVVDISHNISPFNIMEAAYIIENSYKSFPENTIHIIDVDSERTKEKKHIIVKLDNHYFITSDNGIMSILSQNINYHEIYEISILNELKPMESSLKTFSKVACHLSMGGKPEIVGKKINKLKNVKNLKPFVNSEKTQIISSIIYIDHFGNVVTNIKKSFFDEIGKGRKFEISARNYKFNKIYSSYSDIINFNLPEDQRSDEGKALIIFNSNKYLQISIYRSNPENVGTAATLLGLKIYDSVSVIFSS
jgi:S-adenosylmethionine hydrolase|tara:strand:+ start:629 stop:1462 length:834 start_codon:yes stop_codon:yes gene_type:complete